MVRPSFGDLPVSSIPFARDVQKSLDAQDNALSMLQDDTARNNKDLQANVVRLAAQVNTLTGITAQQQVILDQQAALINAQNDLLAAQVSLDNQQAQSTSFTLTTSYQTLIAMNFTFPIGYSRAQMSVSGFVTSPTNNAGGGDRVYAKCAIGGVDGPESNTLFATVGNTTAFTTRQFTGLAGSVYPVVLQARLQIGPGANSFCNATMIASVTYLK